MNSRQDDRPLIPSTSSIAISRKNEGDGWLELQAIPAMAHSIDVDGHIVDVSQRWLEISGYSRSEVIGRKSTDFLTEESRSYAEENVLPEFFRTGRCVDIPYQLVAKDGSILDVLLSANCERDVNGRVVRSIAVMQNISARKSAERKLAVAKAYTERLIQSANVLVVELDVRGRVMRINSEAERVTGFAARDLVGQQWFDVLVPRDQYPEVWEEFERLLATHSADKFQNPIVCKSGEIRHIHWCNSQILEAERVIGTLSIGIDVTNQVLMESRLAESEKLFQEAQTVAQIGSWAMHFPDRNLTWSPEIYRILELDPARTPPSKELFLSLVHPEDRENIRRAYKTALKSGRPYEVKHRLLLSNGDLKYVYQRSEITVDHLNMPLRAVGVIQDVTMRVIQDMALQESEERLQTIADFTFDWEYWQGEKMEILYISPSCQRITGYTQYEFIQDPELLAKIVHPEDRKRFETHLVEDENAEERHIDFRILTKAGEARWIAHGCRAVNINGQRRGRRVSNRDITDLKIAEQLAQRLAHYDVLTGLPNRRMLLSRLTQAVALAKRLGTSLSLMFVDIDKFKYVNDTFGHDVGDELLIQLAQRFAECVRSSDTVARTGGDEFIVLQPDIKLPADAISLAQKILAVARVPVSCAGQTLAVSGSIGIAILDPSSDDDGTSLMKKADMAMYEAKRAGRDTYFVY